MCSNLAVKFDAVKQNVNMLKKLPSKQDSIDTIESQDNDNTVKVDDSEPLEKVKIRAPPGVNASLVLLYGVFLTMFTIGLVNLNNCPINTLIPIYLIVAGAVGALWKFLSNINNKYTHYLALVLIIGNIIWNVLGTSWVFREYQPNYDPRAELYCNRTTFLLAFWILVIQYTLVGIFIVCSLCYLLMRGDFEKQ